MNDTVLVLSIVSAIVAGTPILFAALGEIMTERSGVMNLGVEGMMLIGGVTGFWAGVQTGNLWLALLAGGLAGAVLSGIHALLAISLRVNQIVSGLALVIVGGGLSAFWGQQRRRSANPELQRGAGRAPAARGSARPPRSRADRVRPRPGGVRVVVDRGGGGLLPVPHDPGPVVAGGGGGPGRGRRGRAVGDRHPLPLHAGGRLRRGGGRGPTWRWWCWEPGRPG